MHRCESCGYRQQMDYEKNIECVDPSGVDIIAKTVREGTFRYVCQKCHKSLDRWYNGSWVPKYPERTADGGGTRGYLITQMNAVWISADELKRKELAAKSKQQFYNYVLGHPFEDVSLAVQDVDVISNMREDLPGPLLNRGDYRFISVGIDWGNHHWVTVKGFRDNGQTDLIRAFPVERSRGIENIELDLETIINQIVPYNPDIISADIGDSGNYVDKLIQYFGKGKVYGVKVNPNPRSNGLMHPQWNENKSMVTIDKLTANKGYISDMKMGRIGFYRQRDADLNLYIEHWKNVVIRDEEDDKTGEVYQVIGNKGDDHYAQSAVYAKAGIDHVLAPFQEHGEDEFGYTTISDLKTQPTDIFSKGY